MNQGHQSLRPWGPFLYQNACAEKRLLAEREGPEGKRPSPPRLHTFTRVLIDEVGGGGRGGSDHKKGCGLPCPLTAGQILGMKEPDDRNEIL